MTADLNHHEPTAAYDPELVIRLAGAPAERRVHPAMTYETAHLRALVATAWLTWAATYITLAALATRGLSLTDCLGLATCVTAVALVALGAAWACGGESATVDPALWVGGLARPWRRPWQALHGLLVAACLAVTVVRLL